MKYMIYRDNDTGGSDEFEMSSQQILDFLNENRGEWVRIAGFDAQLDADFEVCDHMPDDLGFELSMITESMTISARGVTL